MQPAIVDNVSVLFQQKVSASSKKMAKSPKSQKSAKPRRKAGEPKRKLTAFNMWMSEQVKNASSGKAKSARMSAQRKAMKATKGGWAMLSAAQKAAYQKKADARNKREGRGRS